jgi:hypothetical protein
MSAPGKMGIVETNPGIREGGIKNDGGGKFNYGIL